MVETARYELVMSPEFVARLHDSIERATRRVFIQVMTFDGDESGFGVADRLVAAAQRGVDVQVTVDSFAFRYVSDTRYTKHEVAEEVAATHAMFDRMEAAGIAIVYINPFGELLQWGAFRNHKKLYVLDDVAYIGGINISDHNFSWLDFNVGLHNPEDVEVIAADFAATRSGEELSIGDAFATSNIVTNTDVEAKFVELVEGAHESIVIASPYALDLELTNRLVRSRAPSKVLIAPEDNNFLTFRLSDPYVRAKLAEGGVELRSFTDFFHAKFAVFDNTTAFVGSSNFGLHSFRCNQEIGLVITDPEFVSQLIEVLERTTISTAGPPSRLRYGVGAVVSSAIRVAAIFFDKVVSPYAPTLTTR